jgi:predicted Zn-dependent protease with MMP-like domain
MRRREFEGIVLEALEELPSPFREALQNIDIQVRWRPTLGELRRARLRRGHTLFGLYLGVPLPKRGHHYSMTVPDTIVIYQQAHERYCRNEAEIAEQARKTLLHEIGHYMGIDEDRLQELGVG